MKIDQLFEALSDGDPQRVAIVLRSGLALTSQDCDLLADFFDPGDLPKSQVPVIIKFAHRGRGRPSKPIGKRNSLSPVFGVAEERRSPKSDADVWIARNKVKPTALATSDYAQSLGIGHSTLKKKIAETRTQLNRSRKK